LPAGDAAHVGHMMGNFLWQSRQGLLALEQ
jgi:hypothetical protein